MAYTLVKGAAIQQVSTDAQRDNLINLGWTLKEGAASDTPYDVHDFSNPTPQDFKGIGFGGENPKSIAYICKQQTQGSDKETYDGLVEIMHRQGEVVPTEEIEVVAALPASGEADKCYLLTKKDATTGNTPNAYTYADGAWKVYGT